jgi:hypothetical protein
MGTLVRIKDNPALVRDVHSKALLNTDRAALDDYMVRQNLALKQKVDQEDTKIRLEKLEQNMSEIKALLSEIASMRKV